MATLAAPNPLAHELKKLLEDEINSNQSHPAWGGTGVVVEFNNFSLTPKMKADVNEIGVVHGCHTCNTHVEIDADQPWIGDHFPPTELKKHARAALGKLSGDDAFTSGKQVLFPQCHACSSQQSALVRKLNTMTEGEIVRWLEADRNELLYVLNLTSGVTRAQKGQTCIPASGRIVTAVEGQRIQAIGERIGCHSDPTHDYAVLAYHADHTWPQEFCTSYMGKVMEFLGLAGRKPPRQELRPQCPRCSGNQGGKMSLISKKATAFAAANNITFYK
jgi:hypothetical protein